MKLPISDTGFSFLPGKRLSLMVPNMLMPLMRCAAQAAETWVQGTPHTFSV